MRYGNGITRRGFAFGAVALAAAGCVATASGLRAAFDGLETVLA